MEACAPHFMDEIMGNPIFEVQTMVSYRSYRSENFERNLLRGVF